MSFRMLAALGATLTATSVSAGCIGPGEPLFHCSFQGGKKEVNVCLQASVVLYTFGPTGGAPEMVLGRDVRGVGMTPWNGVGRTLWEELRIFNNVYTYALSYAIDRMEDAPVEARLIVAEGEDAVLAELICDTGSVTHSDFYPVYEAKEAEGQVYCPDTFSWGSGC